MVHNSAQGSPSKQQTPFLFFWSTWGSSEETKHPKTVSSAPTNTIPHCAQFGPKLLNTLKAPYGTLLGPETLSRHHAPFGSFFGPRNTACTKHPMMLSSAWDPQRTSSNLWWSVRSVTLSKHKSILCFCWAREISTRQTPFDAFTRRRFHKNTA